MRTLPSLPWRGLKFLVTPLGWKYHSGCHSPPSVMLHYHLDPRKGGAKSNLGTLHMPSTDLSALDNDALCPEQQLFTFILHWFNQTSREPVYKAFSISSTIDSMKCDNILVEESKNCCCQQSLKQCWETKAASLLWFLLKGNWNKSILFPDILLCSLKDSNLK